MRKILLTTVMSLPLVLAGGALQAQQQVPLPESGSQMQRTPGGEQGGARGASPSEVPRGNAERATSPGEQAVPRRQGGSAQEQGAPMQEQRRNAQGQGAPTQERRRNAQEQGAPMQERRRNAQEQRSPAQERRRNAQEQDQRLQDQQGAGRDVRPNAPRNAQGEAEGGRRGTAQRGGDVETTGSIDISAEKRTTVRRTIERQHVRPIREVNFSVNVGTVVPRRVELRTLPPDVVEVVPQYRRYRYFVLEDGRIVIVEPSSYRIVYIIA